MSRDVITVGSTMRISLLYKGEYSQWRERFMNYLEEQTDGEVMINSIQNGDQPLPVIAQVSLVGNAQNAPPTLKDPKFWTMKRKRLERLIMRGFEYDEQDRKAAILYEYDTFKEIKGEQFLDTYLCYLQVINDLKNRGYKKDNYELNYKFLNNLQPEWKQYGTLMRQTKNLMDINIDDLYNILKQNQVINDLKKCGYSKDNCELNFKFLNNLQPEWKQYATMMRQNKNLLDINIDALYSIFKQKQGVAEQRKVRKRKEKVVVFSESEGSDDELKKITALLAKAFNRKKFYSKPTNNNLRTFSATSSVNKKQEYVKSDVKKEEKKVYEKKRDMSKVKCYNCNKKGHFAKYCIKAKVKDYEYYKTKMLLAKKDKDEQVLLAEDHAWMESSSDSDQEINANMVLMAQIEKAISDSKASSSFSDDKITEALMMIKKFFMILRDMSKVKCYNCKKEGHFAKDCKKAKEINANIVFMAQIEKVLSDSDESSSSAEETIAEEQNNEFNEQIKVLNEKNADLLAQTEVLQDQLKVKHVVIDTHTECQAQYAKHEEERYEYMIRYSALCDNDKQHRKKIEKQEILFDKMSLHYFEKAKDLRPSIYDENVIGLGYTLMFLIHLDEALEIEKFKRARENKIKFAYDYGNLNASYVNEKINFSDDYFQEITNPDFEKIDSSFQQTSSLKRMFQCDNVKNPKVIAPGMFKISVLQSVSRISITKTSCASKNVENLDTFSIVRRPKHSGVIWKTKGHLILLMMYDSFDENNLLIFDDESVSPVSKMPFKKKPHDSMNMSRDVLTIGSTLRIPLLYRGEYSQWLERFLNYLEEQTDGEAMINLIKNGDQPLPHVTQVTIAGTLSTEQPPLKEKSMWSNQEKRLPKNDHLARSLLIQGLPNDIYSLIDTNKTVKDLWDALARHMLGSEYGEQDRKAADSEGSEADDFNELKKITAFLAKAFNQRKFYSKPTNNNLRTSSTSQSANKKQEFVKIDNKKVKKKDDEKKQDMSRVKCYNCKKERHFAKDCKKVKVKDYEYYKTKMLLANKDKDEQVLLAEDQAWMESSSDLDQEINANIVFMAQIEKVLSDSEASSSSADEKISKSDVDYNDSEEKDHLVDKLIRKFNNKIIKCEKRIEKANQQSKDFENQNKDLQDKYDVLKNQATTFEMNNKELNEQLKELKTKFLKDQLQVKHVVIDTHVECQEK
nr:hypothetical protein [Tanacetum cinerariifolium]